MGGHTGEVPTDPERSEAHGTHALGCLAEAGGQPVDQSQLEDVDRGVFSGDATYSLQFVCCTRCQ